MRSIFLAMMILISAPVYADKIREFAAFLDDYKVFAEKRDIQSKNHSAQFSSLLTFREEQCDPYGGAACVCQPGNNKYLQCLTSAKGVIKTDPNDIGGRGYILVSSSGLTLNKAGEWVPMTTRGVYTATVASLRSTHTINIQIPDASTVSRLCANASGPVEFTVGYGAVMPMEIEFAARMKERSASIGRAYDDQGFIFSRARANGTRARKGAVAGAIECHPSSRSQSGG